MTHASTHTDEQLDILALAAGTTSNLMINALAGTGKTTTLEALESAQPAEPVLYLAFNKKIAEDATKRMRSTTQVRTFNGLGHRIWAQTTARKLSLDPRKVGDILRDVIRSSTYSRSESSELWAQFSLITDAVNRAKTFGYIPSSHTSAGKSLITFDQLLAGCDEAPTSLAEDVIQTVLLRSIASAYAGSVDFADQIYMPTLFNGIFPAFPLTMVDEYQDLNPLNHVMIAKLTKKGRLIGVGDPNQNIYGFRGAVADGMAKAVLQHSMIELPLSQSFRCPEAIVKGVWWHVPHFRWTNPGGACIIRARQSLLDFRDGSVIICRNNAPLFALAMRLLCAGRSVSVAGSDIGPKMLAQMKKLGREDDPQSRVLAAIDDWQTDKESRGSTTAADTAECMRVFAKYGGNLAQAIAYAQHLFAQKGSIALMTGHKSKGLEWSTVYHLDPFLCHDDEPNLKYVIQTRSSDTYIEINSERIEG